MNLLNIDLLDINVNYADVHCLYTTHMLDTNSRLTHFGPRSFFTVAFFAFFTGAGGRTLTSMKAGSRHTSMNGGLVMSCTIRTYSPTSKNEYVNSAVGKNTTTRACNDFHCRFLQLANLVHYLFDYIAVLCDNKCQYNCFTFR